MPTGIGFPTLSAFMKIWSGSKTESGAFQYWLKLLSALVLVLAPAHSKGAGVTVITHGFDSDVNTWVTAMADQIPTYPGFPGAGFTIYKLAIAYDATAGRYNATVSRTNGAPPLNTDSGEIIVKLDWGQLSGGTSPYDVSTYGVANLAIGWLMQTNLIPELGGHALVELPVHLIGHSRGGSLVSEISRQLGTNGLWIDHLTTLDPYPLNNDGNDDSFLTAVVDAPAKSTYANVLFADNYFQQLGSFIDPDGEPVAGAYVRQLTSLGGGYNNTSDVAPYHENVHLWYFGTIDFASNAYDEGASFTSAERTQWWNSYEEKGANAGFYYSRIGGGDQTSTNRPLGAGSGAVRDGYNQFWNLGAGTNNNRMLLSANNGLWPNLVKLNRTGTNQIPQGDNVQVDYYYQWLNTNQATLSFYLDDDLNPLNTNQTLLKQFQVQGTNNSFFINHGNITLPLSATNAAPGWHSIFASISGGGQIRYLYAPELVQVVASQVPTLDITLLNNTQVQVGINGAVGQTLVLQSSTDLKTWQSVATNLLTTARWTLTNSPPGTNSLLFYRALGKL